MKALNIGSLNLDYVYQVDHFVRPGVTLNVLQHEIKPGGKGLNQSVALARAGTEVWHAGCVGRGGESLLELLRANHVRDEYLLPVDELQGNAMIQVNAAGENCILLFGGSNQCLTEKQIDETLSAFSGGDWLILQNEVNLVPVIIEKAWARGLHIILNPSPFDSRLATVEYSKLDWILVNEIEAEQLTGIRDSKQAWEWIHARWPNLSVLITLGNSGSKAWQVQGNTVVSATQDAFRVQPVDTTGAGDTYTGYFMTSLIKNLSLQECMRIASAASAIAVTRPGAAPSIPEKEEVESLLKRSKV